jgi:hypothetical protein
MSTPADFPKGTLYSVRQNLNKIHENECDICAKQYASKRNLREHLQRVHEKIRNFQCDRCPYKCFEESVLRRHKQRIHSNLAMAKFKCHLCDYSSEKKRVLDNHILDFHSTRNSFIRCNNCTNTFLTPIGLLKHSKRCLQNISGVINKQNKVVEVESAVSKQIVWYPWGDDRLRQVKIPPPPVPVLTVRWSNKDKAWRCVKWSRVLLAQYI